MGNDGERLVMDYLSKVGDLAHTTSLSAVERRELVTRVRNEIGEQRSAVQGDESTGDVKRILRRLGRPEDVVAAAGGADGTDTAEAVPSAGPSAGPAVEPGEGGHGPSSDAGPQWPVDMAAGPGAAEVPVPRAEAGPAGPIDPAAPDPPAGHGTRREDWPDGSVGGFVGGILDPDLLRPTPADSTGSAAGGSAPAAPAGPTADLAKAPAPETAGARPAGATGTPEAPRTPAAGTADGAGEPAPGGSGPVAPIAPPKERGVLARRAVRLVSRSVGGRHVGGVIEIAAVATLVAGAVLPSLYALIAGWLLAYWSPRMSRRVAKTAVFGMPGLVVGSYLTWLFGRVNEYWGDPLEGDALQSALVDNYAALLQMSAVASALFLLWRAARRPKS